MAVPLASAFPGVALWRVDLDGGRDGADERALLSADELARADRFVFERHRRRYVVGRAALRRLLAAEIGIDAQRLAFQYGPSGKPALAATHLEQPVWFNVSHSGPIGVVALTRRGPVGVDVEQQRPIEDVLRLAQTAFSAGELMALTETASELRHHAFFAGWTRKEAYIKARGDGIASLRAFDVCLDPRDARLLRAIDGPGELARWAMASFAPADGFTGALCVGLDAPET